MILNFKNKKLICKDCNSIMLSANYKKTEFACICNKFRYYKILYCFHLNINNFAIRAYLYKNAIRFSTSKSNLYYILNFVFKDRTINDYKSLSGFVSDLEKTINNMIFY